MMTLCKGGRVGIYSGKMDLLFEEFQMVRPTLVSAVPRLYNKLYAEYQDALALAKAAKPDLPVCNVFLFCFFPFFLFC